MAATDALHLGRGVTRPHRPAGEQKRRDWKLAMRPQPKLPPIATEVLRVPPHGTCRSSSGQSLQQQTQSKKVNDVLLSDTIFECSAIASCHWRGRHSKLALMPQPELRPMARHGRRPLQVPRTRCDPSGTSVTCNTAQHEHSATENTSLGRRPSSIRRTSLSCGSSPRLCSARHWPFLRRGATRPAPL